MPSISVQELIRDKEKYFAQEVTVSGYLFVAPPLCHLASARLHFYDEQVNIRQESIFLSPDFHLTLINSDAVSWMLVGGDALFQCDAEVTGVIECNVPSPYPVGILNISYIALKKDTDSIKIAL